MNDWLLVASMALVTFLIRYLLLALSGRIQLSPTLVRALGYVPPVVLTAIVVPAVVMPDGWDWGMPGWWVRSPASPLPSVTKTCCSPSRAAWPHSGHGSGWWGS